MDLNIPLTDSKWDVDVTWHIDSHDYYWLASIKGCENSLEIKCSLVQIEKRFQNAELTVEDWMAFAKKHGIKRFTINVLDPREDLGLESKLDLPY
ncbi:hypothetical protein ACFLS9_01250 [Bacteroidota bacterium]